MANLIEIVVVVNPETGQIEQVRGPLDMRAFIVNTLAAAIQIVINRPQEPVVPDMLHQNGKGN